MTKVERFAYLLETAKLNVTVALHSLRSRILYAPSRVAWKRGRYNAEKDWKRARREALHRAEAAE